MQKEIEAIRRALLAINALDDEAKDALATLEEALEETDQRPESGRVREVVRSTAGTLALDNANGEAAADGETGLLAGKWRELKENLSDWEEDHPRVVLAVGRISDSLAVVGL